MYIYDNNYFENNHSTNTHSIKTTTIVFVFWESGGGPLKGRVTDVNEMSVGSNW